LQEFVRVLEEISELVSLGAERLRCQLRRHLDSRHGRIFRDIANLVDLDARFTRERRFQLFRKRGWLGIAAWESAHEPRELWLSQSRREVDAGNSRTHQHLCKAFFTGGCAERHPVQQNLISRCAKQEPAPGALIERASELFPRSLKLRRRSHVAKFIEACELQ
jgi:hypothetical protein